MSTYAEGTARPNGWWGVVLFVAGEATLFLMLFASYFYLRLQSTHWPPAHISKPAVLTPTLLTLALVATSYGMQRAWSSARIGLRVGALRWLVISGAVQLTYVVWQLHDYVDEIHKAPPSHSAYSSIYVTMLGAAHAHVLVGVLLTAWLVARYATGLTPYRLRGLQAITFYWHAVNAITVAVLLVELSPHL
jgi:heme/copper-type cytochrome/quinol oxidase subunit 3